jgi:hypothetical protein
VSEAAVVLGPPAAAAVEALHPTHLLPHRHEARFAQLDPPAHELATTSDGVVEHGEQPASFCGVEPVGIGHETQATGPVRIEPAEAASADVVVDRHAHPGELGHVVHRRPGCCKVEVQQCHRLAVTEHDVLAADVVVTHDGATGGVGHLRAPAQPPWIKGARCLVEPRQQGRRGRKRHVGLRPAGERWDGYVSLDELEPFPVVGVDADGQRRPLEPDSAQ